MPNQINAFPSQPIKGIKGEGEKHLYAGKELVDCSQSFLSMLIGSQKADNLDKIKDLLHQLTILSRVGEESSKCGFLSKNEENSLVDKIKELRQQVEGGSLNIESLFLEIKDILARSVNPKCSIIIHLSEIEHLTFTASEEEIFPYHEEEFQSSYGRIVDSLNSKSNLEINHLNKSLSAIREDLPRHAAEVLSLLSSC